MTEPDTSFGGRLRSAMDGRGRLCVGIDPHPALLDAWGMTDSAVGLERFAMTAVEALAGTAAVVDLLRASVPGPGPDRYLSPEIERAVELVGTGAVLAAVESTIGPLA